MLSSSNVAEFYRGRSVFITGATGFMGKVLVEKLLRSCPGLESAYLLIRSTPKKDSHARLKELIDNKVFDIIRREQPESLKKLIAMEGDVTLPSFGLSPTDLQLLIDTVSIVFNSAATVRFDEDLKTAIEMNVKGPRRLLEICRQMKQLESVVHVSTAFNNLDKEEIEERIYPSADIDPVKLIDFIDSLDTEVASRFTKELVGKCPNTYTYTKAMAEQVLEKESGNVPLAIVRPSIVSAALKEPFPGWIDNLNGMTGIVAGLGKGVLRVMKVLPDLTLDIIPVDYPINLMIVAGWHTALHKSDKITVYGCSTGHKNPFTWAWVRETTLRLWEKYPTVEMMWYPFGYYAASDLSFTIFKALYHQFPAYLLDFCSFLVGKKRRWVRLYDKVHKIFKGYEYFTTHQWRFISENFIHLNDQLSEEDKKVFYFDVRQINWDSYMESNVLGTRQFILNDDPSTLPTARKNLRRMYMIKTGLRILIFLLVGLILTWLWPIHLSFSGDVEYDVYGRCNISSDADHFSNWILSSTDAGAGTNFESSHPLYDVQS